MPNKTKEKKKPAKKPETEKEPAAVVMPAVHTIEVPTDYEPKTKLSKQQIQLVKDHIAKKATDDELKYFLYICERTGLDPFTKQIHLVPRYDGKLGKEIMIPVVGIDGLRSIAERSDAYAGNDDPIMGEEKEITFKETYYEGNTKKEATKTMKVPTTAKAVVRKVVQGIIGEFTATAKWDEYYPGDKSGMMWRKMPDNMLGKCAEAKALRKAFPAVLSGLYVAEEMHQAVNPEADAKAKQDALFRGVKSALQKITNKDELTKKREQLSTSDKYNDEQKAELLGIVDELLARD